MQTADWTRMVHPALYDGYHSTHDVDVTVTAMTDRWMRLL